MCAYANTPNKSAIRRDWNRPVLTAWREEIGPPLTYFGLCGPEIEDLLEWRDLLDPRRTAVESTGTTSAERRLADETMGRMQMNVLAHGVASGFQLLRGNIEDVILDGVDRDSHPPQVNNGGKVATANWGYDLVNLDFDGGLGFRQGGAKRIRAIKQLIQRQAGHSFVLMMTVNVRHQLGEDIDHFIRGLRGRLHDARWEAVADWYLVRGASEVAYRLKAAVPSFIQNFAEEFMFRCTCHPPVAYQGHNNAHMVHFSFELRAADGSLRAYSDADDRALLALPLVRCEGARFVIPELQHPGFDLSDVPRAFGFLPEELAQQIRASWLARRAA